MTEPAPVFMGGGSGGHLYPALAIAEAIRRERPNARCVFLCSTKPIDATILSSEGVEFHPIPAAPAVMRPTGLVRLMRSWGPSVRTARAVFQQLKRDGFDPRPVAMGGYVAAPCVQAASAEKRPALMVNLDAVPGLANKYIARKATRIVTAAPVEGRDWTRVRPIVRRAALPSRPPTECRASFTLDPDRRTLLVTGGSQGARSVGDFLAAFVRTNPGALEGWQILHQTGGAANAEYERAYADAGVRALVVDYIDRMGDAWGGADLAIARAGAGAVAEAWGAGVPCLFMPYPYHKDQHQKRNAAPLVECGGAQILDDHIDAKANLAAHAGELSALLTSPDRLASMRMALSKLPRPDGADAVARMILDA
ncbi:MAG: glycosyltransferase [Phycisphaerales bacterium]